MPDTRFKPGQSGNPKGRPKGSRNKVTQKYLDKLWDDFKEHGAAVLEEVRASKPEVYLRLVADLVPKQMETEVIHTLNADDLSDAELADIATGGSERASKTARSKKQPTQVH